MRREGRVIETHEPVLIDVGAVGKGYLVDQVGQLLTAQGFDAHVVDVAPKRSEVLMAPARPTR